METLLNFDKMMQDISKQLKQNATYTVLICSKFLLYLFLTKTGKKDSRLSI
jgi:hypothetical protein